MLIRADKIAAALDELGIPYEPVEIPAEVIAILSNAREAPGVMPWVAHAIDELLDQVGG